MSESEELEAIRQKRLMQMLQQQSQQQSQQQIQQQIQEEQIGAQIKLIIHQILEPEARERLGNIRLARPEFARQIEIFLIQLYQAGRLPKRLSDAQFKEILEKLHEKRQGPKGIIKR